MCLTNLANTKAFWEDYVKNIAVPVEYQEAVIRAGITLSLNTYEETVRLAALDEWASVLWPLSPSHTHTHKH